MKKHKAKKRIIQILLIIILPMIMLLSSTYYIISRNNLYQEKLTKKIKKNYKTNEIITKTTKYENNYIIITEDFVIVLDKKYKELLKEELSTLAVNPNNYELIYKNNKLMYEETILKKNNVTYKYYDAYTYEIINKVTLEG